MRNWRRRWFVLEEASAPVLRYYEAEGGRLKGEVPLADSHIELLPAVGAREFLFGLFDNAEGGKLLLKMEAPTDVEMRAWGSALDHRFFYQELLGRHEEAVRCLSEPTEFVKHGRMGNPHRRIVFLSPDQSSLCWRKAAGSDLQRVSLVADPDSDQEVTIVAGATTAVFRRTGVPGMDHCCFSIVTRERSLDLQTSSEEERDNWVLHLTSILAFHSHRRKKRGARGGGRGGRGNVGGAGGSGLGGGGRPAPRDSKLMKAMRAIDAGRR